MGKIRPNPNWKQTPKLWQRFARCVGSNSCVCINRNFNIITRYAEQRAIANSCGFQTCKVDLWSMFSKFYLTHRADSITWSTHSTVEHREYYRFWKTHELRASPYEVDSLFDFFHVCQLTSQVGPHQLKVFKHPEIAYCLDCSWFQSTRMSRLGIAFHNFP